ncbi:MAG: sulfotransferase, partial [Bacteroidales bacterium]|nr:sulfotransferase [Bacteroidales bacterium]
MSISNCLPNLIIPGAGKSGTSSLHRYLNLHPDIYMTENKEPFFFYRDKLYHNEKEWYKSLFEPGADKKYRGESSTAYLSHPTSIERMKNDLPDPRFIILLRNPVERIISHYFWLKGKGLEHRSLKDAVMYDKDYDITEHYHIRKHGKCYLQFSYYAKWVKIYYDVFGKENVLILTTESLKNKPLETLNQCFDFLELPAMKDISLEKEYNVTINRDIPGWDAKILY